jgi:hypothetical protein
MLLVRPVHERPQNDKGMQVLSGVLFELVEIAL